MGKLLIFSAPSGSGKTTIVKEVIKQVPKLKFSVSACSRAPRINEIHGIDYYFYTPKEFKLKIENDEFIEYEEVYTNQFYGTLKSELDRIWNDGNHVVFDVDVKGGLNIRKKFEGKSLAIFIKPPSIDELRKRLLNRGTENNEQIEKRIRKAEYELSFANQFDVIILNADLQTAINETIDKVRKFLEDIK